MAKKQAEDTPMLKQFYSIKAQHPEAVLLYRVGDFYETYGDDAVLASKLLGLVLTHRSNGEKGDVPMAGVPHHAIQQYLPKLVRAGHKVAICDQLEDPKQAVKLVKRGITEILTPGVAFADGMLEQKEHNWLCALHFEGSECGAAFLDVSTGTFHAAQGSLEYIGTLISSLSPKEIVAERDFAKGIRERWGDFYITPLDGWAFVYDSARDRLMKQFGVETLKGFGVDACPLAICSAGALLVYLEQTEHAGLRNICSISRIDEGKYVWMDRFTIRNLEVFQSNAGKDGVSLADTIDRCASPMGSRLLRQWLAMPILDRGELESRYDSVQYFFDHEEPLRAVRELISDVGDLERIISRAATGRILPREMLQLSRSLAQMQPIRTLCEESQVPALQKVARSMKDCSRLQKKLSASLMESPAIAVGRGDVIAAGVSKELDELRSISRGGKDFLVQLQQSESERTGIGSLKIGFNNVFGYYLEVRNTFKDKVPPEWHRKQTLVGCERYITDELKQYEEKILTAEESINKLESEIYAGLVADVQAGIRDIQRNCAAVARTDVLQGFALQAVERGYCRPEVNSGTVLDIREGRHPVIETLMAPGEEYVPNDVHMDSSSTQIIILTGPNMAGKSALLRQTALIVLMAQAGSFVPAKKASFGYFDKIFTRVGATDNISRGESTFMVEMLETATIMHNLSARSLVLLDEIGRGTSTYDGMSIARALVEYIHKFGKGAKTLFATHYHELNDLADIYPRVKNYHIAVKEMGQDVIFLRKMEEGGTAHSFGIHVARMAGMPREIVESAEHTLHDLEMREHGAKTLARSGGLLEDGSLQLSLFQLDDPTLASLRSELEAADLNNMTPMQAFDLLRKMKQEIGL